MTVLDDGKRPLLLVFTTFDANTMPHIIQRQSNGNSYCKKIFLHGNHVRLVIKQSISIFDGRFPSFIGKKISQTFFHRNRLGFLCDENIILSRPGDLGNFFQESDSHWWIRSNRHQQQLNTSYIFFEMPLRSTQVLVVFGENSSSCCN